MKEEVKIPQSLQEQAEAQMKSLLDTGEATTEEHMAEMVKASHDLWFMGLLAAISSPMRNIVESYPDLILQPCSKYSNCMHCIQLGFLTTIQIDFDMILIDLIIQVVPISVNMLLFSNNGDDTFLHTPRHTYSDSPAHNLLEGASGPAHDAEGGR